jgi:hypothetical protein
MLELSQSEFSKLAGVSRAAIGKAVKFKKLSLNKNKKIDPKHKLSVSYIKQQKQKGKSKSDSKKLDSKIIKARNNLISKQSKKTTKKPSSKTGKNKKKPDDSEEPDVNKIINEIGKVTEQDRIRDPGLKYLTKAELERQKIIEDILQRQIKNDKDREKLIDRDFVKRMFLELYNIDVNEFLQLPALLSSKVCTIFKDDDPKKIMQLNETIEKELYRSQKHIKKEIDKFLEKMQKDAKV